MVASRPSRGRGATTRTLHIASSPSPTLPPPPPLITPPSPPGWKAVRSLEGSRERLRPWETPVGDLARLLDRRRTRAASASDPLTCRSLLQCASPTQTGNHHYRSCTCIEQPFLSFLHSYGWFILISPFFPQTLYGDKILCESED